MKKYRFIPGYLGILFLAIQIGYSQCGGINPDFTFSVPPPACSSDLPLNLILINTSSGGSASTATYYWYLNGTPFDTTTGLATSSTTLTTTGNFQFMMIVELGACKDTVVKTFKISQTPNANFTISPPLLCATDLPATLTLTNTSSDDSTGSTNFTCLWEVNGVPFATTNTLTASVNYTISTPGIYTFKLTVTDPDGCTDTHSVVYEVPLKPTASFSAPATSCQFYSISFTNTSTNTTSSTTYQWNFGDGNTSTQQNPIHSYILPGTYTVQLIVCNNAACCDTTNATIQILDSPIASINADDGDGDNQYCLSPFDTTKVDTVLFTSSSTCPGGGCTYTWHFGDGSPDLVTTQDTPVVHYYTAYGEYWAWLQVDHPNGCTSRDSVFIVFEPLLVSASFDIPPGAFAGGCPPFDVLIHNISHQNATYFVWDYGDGNRDTIIPPDTNAFTYTYNSSGTYIITLYAGNACGSTFTSKGPIQVAPQADVNFTYSPSSPTCAPITINFNATGTNISPSNNYHWYFGDGTELHWVKNPPPHNYDTMGVYQVMLVAGNACGNDTAYATIYLDSIPVVDVIADPDTGCHPLTVNFINNSQENVPSGSWANHEWWIDGGVCCGPWWNPCAVRCSNYTTDTIPPQTFTNPSGNVPVTHTVRYVLSNHCGTRDTTINIVVHPPVVARFTQSASTICVGGTVTFTNNSWGDSLTFIWDFGNGVVHYDTAYNPSDLPITYNITYTVPDTYIVRLIAKGYCGEDTLERQLIVYPYPLAQFVPSPDSGCTPLTVSITNMSELGGSYSWTFVGGSPSTYVGYNPPNILFTSIGSHPITLTVTKNGCASIFRDTVEVFPLPPVNFTLSPSSGCSPLNVTITNASPNIAGYTYIWDYGNGNVDTSYTPTPQIYTNTTSSPITYTIKLVIITDKGCRDSLSRTVTVYPIPVVDFSFSPDSGCRPLNVTITNSSTTGGTYNWSFTGATPSSSTLYNPPPVIFNTSGTQYITLTVTKFGCSNTKTDSVYVEDLPVVNFTASPTNGCTPLNVALTNTSPNIPGYTYIWDYGNGNKDTNYTPTTPQTYVNSGSSTVTYDIKLMVIATTGCKDSMIQTVSVSPLPQPNFTIFDDTICLNEPLQLSNTSTGSTSYQWYFGDGNTSTQINPSHIYAQPGDYIVKLIVSSGAGCVDSISKPVHVDSIPEAGFTATIECIGNPTLFTDTSKQAISWNWDFGDGNTTTLQNPSHLYASDGTYPVQLIVENAKGCRDTVIQNVIVNPKPTAAFSATTSCYGTVTQFTDLTSGSPIAWNWNFGDGNTSILQNPQHLYASPGTYTVKLVVSSGIGCQDSITQNVTVKPVPTASFSFDTVCAQDDQVTFINTSTGGVNYQWDFGDGNTSTLMNPTHTYANGGTYNVTLIVENNVNCFDTLTQSVPVYEKPQISINADTVCLNVPSQFLYNSTVPLNQWNWDFGDFTGSTQPTPTHVYTVADTFVVTLIGTTADGCKDTAQTLAIVKPLPIADFSADTVCQGLPTSFVDNSFSAVNWSWDFGDGNSSTLQHPTHVYASDGTFNVTLIVFNSAGCSDTTAKNVIVHPNPIANFGADTVCLNFPTTFTDSSVGAIQWYYLFGDGNTSTQTNPQHVYATPDTFIAQQIVTNIYGCKDTTQRLVIVKERPSASFTYNPACALRPMQFYDNSTGSINLWNWNFGDGNSSTQQNPIHSYTTGGLYNVELIVGNAIGCYDTVMQTIQVYTMPQPDFIADTVCVGNPTHFTNLSTDSVPMTYLWDFGDGNNSFQTNPIYIYGAPGTYQVTLVVTNQFGCDTFITKPVIVSPVPQANFEVDTACFGTPSSFVSTTTGIVTQYIWQFGDGTTDTTSSGTIQHQYPAPGTYFVTLTVRNGDCVDGTSKPAIVVDSINAEFAASDQLICPGDAVDFVDLSTGNPTQWQWNMGDGNILTTQHVSQYVYSNPGVYTIILTAQNQHCIDQDSFTLYVSTAPASLFSFNDTCVNQPVFFVNNSDSGLFQVQYIWNFGDGTLDSSYAPVHVYTKPGNYTVQLIVDNGRCPDTLTQTIQIHPQPTLAISIHDSITRIWREVEFQDQSSSSLVWMFWDIGDGTTSNLPLFTHIYSDTGTYPVIFIGEDANGCRDTLYSKVVVQGEFTIFVPTAFSPNGDGVNDEFFPNGIFFDVRDLEMTIYDRWGNIVYQTRGFEPWDGTDQRTGKPVPEDAYVFVVKGKDFQNRPFELAGTVTVIR